MRDHATDCLVEYAGRSAEVKGTCIDQNKFLPLTDRCIRVIEKNPTSSRRIIAGHLAKVCQVLYYSLVILLAA